MDLLVLIAKAADVCLKPWSHAVVLIDPSAPEQLDDLHVRIESRDGDGQRHPDRDLELEIYRRGYAIILMLSWGDHPERPMLWHGRHPVWMDGASGQRCSAPQDATPLEALGRRLRALVQPAV
mgnify:CR=1 FL=1